LRRRGQRKDDGRGERGRDNKNSSVSYQRQGKEGSTIGLKTSSMGGSEARKLVQKDREAGVRPGREIVVGRWL